MPIFPNIEIEPIVQVGDRTRLDASKSFATPDMGDVTKIEIDPGTGTFIDVTPGDLSDLSSAFLDWVPSVLGTNTINCRVTCGANGPTTVSAIMEVITAVSDKLFSSDTDLQLSEPDILKWVSPGRNTFKNIHRAAQEEIIRYLDEKGYTDAQLNPLTKAAVIDLNEVKLWSKFIALRLIFEGISNSTDDVFHAKADRYYGLEKAHRDKALLRLDIDGDGQVFQDEGVYIGSGNLFRR